MVQQAWIPVNIDHKSVDISNVDQKDELIDNVIDKIYIIGGLANKSNIIEIFSQETQYKNKINICKQEPELMIVKGLMRWQTINPISMIEGTDQRNRQLIDSLTKYTDYKDVDLLKTNFFNLYSIDFEIIKKKLTQHNDIFNNIIKKERENEFLNKNFQLINNKFNEEYHKYHSSVGVGVGVGVGVIVKSKTVKENRSIKKKFNSNILPHQKIFAVKSNNEKEIYSEKRNQRSEQPNNEWLNKLRNIAYQELLKQQVTKKNKDENKSKLKHMV